MNWQLLRAHGVHVEPTGAGWSISYADEHGRRYTPGVIYGGDFWPMGQFDWPAGLRGAVWDLAAIMAPVVHCDVRNLAQRTEQQVFDYIALRLLMQGEKSTRDGGQCCLRGQCNGLKCAMGWLIPDELYRPWMEDLYVPDLLTENWSGHQGELIEKMRGVHDDEPPESWPELFEYPHQYITDGTDIGDLEPFPRGATP